ncbi:hypothetical protein AAMO2058_000549900 [Amorphochlora amoebiformis]
MRSAMALGMLAAILRGGRGEERTHEREGLDDLPVFSSRGRSLTSFHKFKRRLVRIKGDGFCLYRALSSQIFGKSSDYPRLISLSKNHLLPHRKKNSKKIQIQNITEKFPLAALYLPSITSEQVLGEIKGYTCLEGAGEEILESLYGALGGGRGGGEKDRGGLLDVVCIGLALRRVILVWVGTKKGPPAYIFTPKSSSNTSEQVISCKGPLGLYHDGEQPVGHWDAIFLSHPSYPFAYSSNLARGENETRVSGALTSQVLQACGVPVNTRVNVRQARLQPTNRKLKS